MTERPSGDLEREERIAEVLGGYLEAVEAGRATTRAELLARHPEIAEELAAFLAQEERFALLIDPLRAAAEAAEGVEPTMADTEATLPRLPSGQAHLEAETSLDQGETMSATPPPDGSGGNGDGDPDEPLPRGDRVRYFGDYEVLGELGRGGMGIVYNARQVSLNRHVALKMLRSDVLASDDELRRFQNEAEAVALLDHPHIVPILEVGKHDSLRYFSMKLIGGQSLDKKLAEYASDPKGAARLVATVAETVHHAHRRGILHRDLKPANILVDDRGEPHVTDFGLAKRVESDSELTQSGAILGTPAYMAPEQASGRRGAVTTASDVYGLGAILYALLTCRAPFRGATIEETLEQVRQSTPEPPSRINARTPRDLEVICLKCLEKEPQRRYESAAALAHDLRRFQVGEPIMARPVRAGERFWWWCRRNPSLAGSLGAVAAALVAVAALALLYAGGQARARTRITTIANELKKSLDDSETLGKILQTSLATSNQRLAALHFERGQVAIEKGQTGRGLLWMIESWRSAIAAGDRGWQHTARANLGAWRRHHIGLKAIFSHEAEVIEIAFSPDSKVVITGSRDKTARLWDVATSEPIGQPMEHQSMVNAVAFSPDSKTVLTGSYDKTARLWDATTSKPIGPPLEHEGRVNAVAFSPDGKAVLTGSSDKTARVWPITELPDDLPRLTTWVELITGLELDEQASIRRLDNRAWRQRRERLEREGGPPDTSRR